MSGVVKRKKKNTKAQTKRKAKARDPEVVMWTKDMQDAVSGFLDAPASIREATIVALLQRAAQYDRAVESSAADGLPFLQERMAENFLAHGYAATILRHLSQAGKP